MWKSESEPFRDFPAIELERLLRAVGAAGADSTAIRCALGLPPDAARARVPVSVFNAVLLEAESQTGDSLIGVHAAKHSTINHLTRALAAAQPTFRDGLRQFLEFQALLFGTQGLTARRETPGVRLLFGRGLDAGALRRVVEFYMCAVCREAIETVGPLARPVEIRFAHAPAADPSAYRATFGCAVEFYASNSAALFSKDVLDVPIATANSAIAAELRRHAKVQIGRLPSAELSGRVTSAIEAAILSRQRVECTAVARLLGMSTRTLQRRLGDEGLTFRGLVDRERHRLITRVMRPELERSVTVAELADLVGFDEPASMCRAFKRWTGEPLSSWSTDRKKREESSVAPTSG